MAVVHLDVDDTSPTISYSPSSSTSSTDPVTGWTPCFSLSGCNTKTGTIPNGTSYYITADDDASFSLCWHGTGVQLMGNVSDTSHLNYTVYLDGNPVTPDLIDLSQQVLASFQNLPSQEHNVSLVVHASKSNVGFLAFNKATLTSPSPINGTGNYTLQSINDTSVAWYGLWSFEPVSQLGRVHRSTNAGDKVTTYFKGTTALTLSGITTPYSAAYSVSLGSSENNYTTDSYLTTTNLSAKTSFTNSDALLFYASSLDPTFSYSLTVTNEDGGELMIKPGGFQVFEADFPVPPPPRPPTPRAAIETSISNGSIAAVVLAGVLFFVLAALLVYYCLIHRPRVRRCQAQLDAMLARTTKGGSPAVRSQVTKASERSSYRKRLNRIISMLGPNSSGQWSGQRPPPVPPIAISRTTERFHDNNAMPDVNDEIEVVLIGEPTTTVESAYRPPEGIKGTRRVPSIFIDITQKPSPEASIPVSPTSVSIGATQSQRQSSQNSSRRHSNTFSIPISFSLRHIRARSKENGTGSTGSSGRQQGRGSSSVGHRDVGVEYALEEEDGSVDSESTIAFAKPTTPRRLASWRGISENTGEAKHWSREGVGKVIHSIISGLRNAGGRWIRASTGTGVVYPFVGVASSSVPFGTRHAVSGGGFIILEGGRGRLDPRLSGAPSSSARDSKRPRSESPHSQGTGQETDITPLSYVNHSLGSLSARDNHLKDQRNDDSGAPLANMPPPRHPYAAVADSPSLPSVDIPAAITSPGDDGAQEPAKTLTVPAVPAIRQLPPVPAPPHINISQQLPSHVADDSTGRIVQIVRPIRALPPLPIPPVSEAVTETSSPVKALSSPSRTRPPPLELATTTEVVEPEGLLLPPKSASDVHTESQRTSRSSKSSKGSSLADFLTISSMSPFRVDFLEMASVDGSEGSDSGRNSSVKRGKQKERRPVLPKLNVTLASTSTRPISLPPALETARHAIQRSFLDLSNGSSSSFGKPEPSSPAEPPPETYPQGDRVVEVDEDRATFGQKRDRKSVYYYSSANPPLPSPAESHHTFQTHRTYQTYQSEEQSSHRPWSKGRHASWRATFGVRPEYIPEEATPSTPDVPFLPPEIAEASQNVPAGPLTTLQEIPECQALTSSLPQETRSDPDQGRLSYVSTSPTIATHVHPLTTDFGLRQHARRRSLHPDVSTSQLDAASPTTDEVSPSSIQFRAGGIRRTSSGDVEPR